MAAEEKKTSLWLWLSLILIILSFAAFILFLDKNIVKNAQRQPVSETPQKNTAKPVFDFYTVLPEREVEIPAIIEEAGDKKHKSQPKIKVTGRDRYLMQVGSYQTLNDADRQKAQLALLGLEATISSAKVAGVTYYRVEMGPFDASQYSSVQKSLIENDVDFLPKKVR
jgi:cell division protein FtsN